MTTTPHSIDATTLQERLESHEVRLLDVRTPAEYETAHIPGSYNVPLAKLREHREELSRHLDDEVVLICRSGARAGQAGQTLASTGLPGLRVLQGGITAWEASGAPVSRGRQTWELERQVRLVAGGLVASSIAGSTLAPRMKWLAGAVGTGLVIAALTNTCAMGGALARLPWNRGPQDLDMREVLASLSDSR